MFKSHRRREQLLADRPGIRRHRHWREIDLLAAARGSAARRSIGYPSAARRRCSTAFDAVAHRSSRLTDARRPRRPWATCASVGLAVELDWMRDRRRLEIRRRPPRSRACRSLRCRYRLAKKFMKPAPAISPWRSSCGGRALIRACASLRGFWRVSLARHARLLAKLPCCGRALDLDAYAAAGTTLQQRFRACFSNASICVFKQIRTR